MSMIFVLLGSICEYPSDPFVEAKHIEIPYFIWMLICLWISINQPAISWFMRPPSDVEAMTLQKLQDFTPQHTHPMSTLDVDEMGASANPIISDTFYVMKYSRVEAR